MPDYQKIIQSSVNYIENNLGRKFEMEEVSDYAGFSLFHFMRVFDMLTGYHLKEYIRVRRLSEAAAKLVGTDILVKELAGRMGFDSSEAFIRAFRREFGITPTQYRRNNQLIHYTPKLKVQICRKINGGNKMDYKIKEMPELVVLGMKKSVKHDGSIAKAWEEFTSRYPELAAYKDAPVVGVIFHDKRFTERAPKPDESFSYMPGIIVQEVGTIPPGMEVYTLKATRYAIFSNKGEKSNLSALYQYMCGEWINNVEYEFAPFDEIEWYRDINTPLDQKMHEMDLYIPIK
jgi:AraC family transcriptional regulator